MIPGLLQPLLCYDTCFTVSCDALVASLLCCVCYLTSPSDPRPSGQKSGMTGTQPASQTNITGEWCEVWTWMVKVVLALTQFWQWPPFFLDPFTCQISLKWNVVILLQCTDTFILIDLIFTSNVADIVYNFNKLNIILLYKN